MVCSKVNFTRDIVSTCAVDTSIERWESGEHIQGVGFIFPPTVAVKNNQWHYFWSHLYRRYKKIKLVSSLVVVISTLYKQSDVTDVKPYSHMPCTAVLKQVHNKSRKSFNVNIIVYFYHNNRAWVPHWPHIWISPTWERHETVMKYFCYMTDKTFIFIPIWP